MGEWKLYILIVIWTLIFADLAVLSYLVVKKNETFKKKNLGLFSIFVVLIILSSYTRAKYGRFLVGECFIVENQEVVPLPKEEWDKEAQIQTVEYQILKVGKENYLTHSSQPSFGNFSFKKDLWLEKTDCSMIFKGKE